MEVQSPWTEGEHVRPVAQVLGDDDVAGGCQDAVKLIEQRLTGLVGPKLMGREQQQRRINRAGDAGRWRKSTGSGSTAFCASRLARAIDGSVMMAGLNMSKTRPVEPLNSVRRAGVDSSRPAWMLIHARGREPGSPW